MTRDERRKARDENDSVAAADRSAPLSSRVSRLAVGIVALAALPACREAFTTSVDVVAKAGGSELTVDRLAEIFAQGKALVLRRDVIERVAHLWVDYSLFAERSVAGDSLLDSTTVVTARWLDVQQRLADHFHDQLVAKQGTLDSAHVDSAYRAGEYRLLKHILIRIQPTMAPPAKDAKRRQAAGIHARLKAGGSWAEANRRNEDPRAQSNGGSLGVIARGEMPPAFENAAFALEPGAISDVVETSLGFHVIARPRLRDERTAFAAGFEARVVERMDSAYLAGLAQRRHVRVKSQAAATVRAALGDPMRSAASRTVIGAFDGGKFTLGDFVRWFQVMSTQVQQQVPRADEEQLNQFIRSLIRLQALQVEAESAGVRLEPGDLLEFTHLLRRDLDQVRVALGIDAKALPDTGTAELRQRLAALHVDQYLEAVASNRVQFMSVPPFLSVRLRERGSWRVVSAAIDRVLERGQELRAVVDSLRPPAPPAAQPDDSGGANANP